MRLPVFLWVSLCLSAAPGPVVVVAAGADRSCTDLRQFYTGKGFTLLEVPQTEISGEFFGEIYARTMCMHFTPLIKSVF